MKPRARDLGITIGQLSPGPLNAITDVPGVRVAHVTLQGQADSGKSINSGVTLIEPRAGSAREQPCFAGVHVLNGNGDATGLEWVREAGLLTSPIAFTNTHSIGTVRDALVALERDALADRDARYWSMPVVMETYDGLLNDINGFHVRPEHVATAQQAATSGPVAEGAVGGGTGMICHEFKGGSGTASRRLSAAQGGWTVGAIVQANHGQRRELRVDGYPVGRFLDAIASPFQQAELPHPGMGSIVVCLATDAGGGTEDSGGDIFIAFATGNDALQAADYAHKGACSSSVQMVNNDHLSELFLAAAEAVEEAIINALLAATETQGNGHLAKALDGPSLLAALRRAGWSAPGQG